MLLYNTLSKKVERFRAVEKGKVRLYTCGPTVHDFAHIGNFRTFLIQDVLKRWLEFRGYNVIHVMNITDIDEKTIEKSKRKKTELNALTEGYAKAFFEDLKTLNMKKASFYPLTSKHTDEMKKLAEKLVKTGFAFEENGDIFFDVSKFKNYGKLSGKKPAKNIRRKSEREDYNEPLNFSLWIGKEQFFRRGRPGWHIECSTLALEYLGQGLAKRDTILDIHSGGEDLIFPHHENEIAVCEALTGKKYARFWVHVKHLNFEGKKMSKSLGNYYTIRDFLARGFSPSAIRLALLFVHYSRVFDFSSEKVEEAEEKIEVLSEVLKKLNDMKTERQKERLNERLKKAGEELKKDFKEAMDNDLNVEKAIEVLFGFVHFLKKEIKSRKVGIKDCRMAEKEINNIMKVLGITAHVEN